MSRKVKFANSLKKKKNLKKDNIQKLGLIKKSINTLLSSEKKDLNQIFKLKDVLKKKRMQSPTRYRKCCEITGRQRGVTRFGISGLTFRKFASLGYIVGVKKHSNK